MGRRDVCRTRQRRVRGAPWGRSVRLAAVAMALALSVTGRRAIADESPPRLMAQTEHKAFVLGLAFSPDGKLVATGSDDHTIQVHDAASGLLLRRLRVDSAALPVLAVAISPDRRRLVAGRFHGCIDTWDLETGRLLAGARPFEPEPHFVKWVRFTRHGRRVLAWQPNGALACMDCDSLEVAWVLGTDDGVSSCAVLDADRIVTGHADGTVRVRAVADGAEIARHETGLRDVRVLACWPAGQDLLVGDDAGTVARLALLDGRIRWRDEVADVGLRCACVAPDGHTVLLGDRKGWVRLLAGASGEETARWRADEKPTAMAVDPEFQRLAVVGQATSLRLLDVRDGREATPLPLPASVVRSVSFGARNRVRVGDLTFDMPSGRLVSAETPTPSPLGGRIAVDLTSPDGRWQVVASEEAKGGLFLVRDLAGDAERFRFGTWRGDGFGEMMGVQAAAISKNSRYFAAGGGMGEVWVADLETGQPLDLAGHDGTVAALVFAPDGDHLLTAGGDATVRLWNLPERRELGRLEGHGTVVHAVAFSPDGDWALTAGEDGSARLWDWREQREACRIHVFPDLTYAILDPEGRFDASSGGDVAGLHWVVGEDPISLDQLKERYYDPGLLAKVLGLHSEPRRKVGAFRAPRLHPAVEVLPPAEDGRLVIRLCNRGGGIGRVVVRLNGKEVTADARGAAVDPGADEARLVIDLAGDPRIVPGTVNRIVVEAWNEEGYLRSRGRLVEWRAPGEASTAPPSLYAVVCGVGDYRGEKIDLRFAAKDAEDFAAALGTAAARLYGEARTHVRLLTTSAKSAGERPDRSLLLAALQAAQRAEPGDVFVLYLAGHGVSRPGDGEFYYLTAEAASANLQDPAVRQATALSSAELADLLRSIPAQKQVLVLDTCASGRLVETLTEQRNVSGSQIRALERVKDRTGIHVLAGCAADRVSYEATRYAQGLLTYSLLLGMRGAALREEEFVDVSRLFAFAADQVPDLAHDVGGVQRPVIAAPRGGGSFDLGRLTAADRERIPLMAVRPLVVRTVFQEERRFRDSLGLSRIVDAGLRDLSAGRRNPPLVFLDARECPGAVMVGGRYDRTGNSVRVDVQIFRDEEDLGTFVVEGAGTQPDDIGKRIVDGILAVLSAPASSDR